MLQYCCSIAAVLLQYCCSITAVLLQYCCSIAAVLLQYCCSIAAVLLQYCCSIAAGCFPSLVREGVGEEIPRLQVPSQWPRTLRVRWEISGHCFGTEICSVIRVLYLGGRGGRVEWDTGVASLWLSYL